MRLTVQVQDNPVAPVIPSNKELFSREQTAQRVSPEQLHNPDKKLPAPLPEPDPVTPVVKLKDSKYVQLTAKEVKNLELPEYLQLELNLNPLKEGETLSADQDGSIRHRGKP